MNLVVEVEAGVEEASAVLVGDRLANLPAAKLPHLTRREIRTHRMGAPAPLTLPRVGVNTHS